MDSDDVSSTATDELPPLAGPELPPPPDPTEEEDDFIAVWQMFARRNDSLDFSTLPSFHDVFSDWTRLDGGDGGGNNPRQAGDVVDARANARANDDAAYGGGFRFGFGAVPASGVVIACLPETTVGQDEARERGECAVCLDEFQAGDALRTMPCAHGFHERCIFQWLRASRLYPLCRFALPA